MAGARVIITSSSNDKLERAKDLGAWQTINYSEVPEWDKVVLELTDGGVDHVLDVGERQQWRNPSMHFVPEGL